MIFISNIENKDDGSVYLKYSVNFKEKTHNIYGDATFSSEEASKAFRQNKENDLLNGFKILVSNRLSEDVKALELIQSQTKDENA